MTMTTPTDHPWLRQNARDRLEQLGHVRCDGICDEPATHLTLWNRPQHPTFCACSACRTSPACAEHVARWRERDASGERTQLVAACTMPAGWHPDDGWPGGTT